jgi:hypothetical protein
MTELQRIEYDAWRQVCNDLRSRNVVSYFDLDSPVGESRTAGQRLLNNIRAWGQALAALTFAKKAQQPQLGGIVAELERLARELLGIHSGGMSLGKTAVQAYYNAMRVVKHAFGQEDA